MPRIIRTPPLTQLMLGEGYLSGRFKQLWRIFYRSPILKLWSARPNQSSASRFVLKSGELKGDTILKKFGNYGKEMFFTSKFYPAAHLSFLCLF